MSAPITVSALSVGDRVLLDPHDSNIFAATDADARAAEVLNIERVGRRRRVLTDIGSIEAGPTARVLLATTEETEPTASEAAPLTAVVTVDEGGRLTPDSTVAVGDTTAPVPAKVDRIGGLGPLRVARALRELGFRTVGPWVDQAPGVASAPVEPLP
ncbi:hypothetical protein GCM10010168_52960 [Actinoplanes ianthinogenes]|uniref:Uncharacterized protein n=1 Tax=Actinoplanes ianthinogenes TaxID=122358 RepID=A0ABM7LQZ6_9ACTN|nr:hypothetical protein [Actinoplanes ianthinogenes]BCJ41706.1 hypothetical protein Aiant_23630 [Actinoplanes ianthinogenes]GGR28286.1 hypothetical protein GCM10010168_52960 [Actinoplanes ianthinogenes]